MCFVRSRTLLLAGVSVFFGVGTAWGQSVSGTGVFPGGTYTYVNGISRDGASVVGYGDNASGSEAYIWTAGGGMVGLGDLAGGTYASFANAVSADGSVVAGISVSGNGYEAFRWTSGGGMVGLGDLAGGIFYSDAKGISDNGQVLVGVSNSGNGDEAFRWTSGGGMVGLGDLAGGGFNSYAYGANADGSVVVGYGDGANGQEAFRWTAGGGMVGLGDLAGSGFSSAAMAVNSDGSVVVGSSQSTLGIEAFRWTAGSGMVGLGALGGTFSSANGVSGDGQVVVGESENGVGDFEAFLWTAADGMVSVRDTLATTGVDVSNWALEGANGTNSDGSIIIGSGRYNGNAQGFIANMGTGGLTTPEELGSSIAETGVTGGQSTGVAMGQLHSSLLMAKATMRGNRMGVRSSSVAQNVADIEPAAGGADRGLGFFVLGTAGWNDGEELSGVTGVTAQLNDEVGVGVGVMRGTSLVRMDNHGKSSLDSTGGMVVGSYEAKDSGLRAYGSAYAAGISQDVTRGYMNGSGLDYSRGTAEGKSLGADVRLGWQEHLADMGTRVMPYVEGRYVHTSLDGYTETGGAFAASYDKRRNDYSAALFGAEIEHDFWKTVTLTGRLAGGRRLSGGGTEYQANVGGSLSQSVSWAVGDKYWMEGALGLTWQYAPDVQFIAETRLRSGDVLGTDVAFHAGTNIQF